MRIQLTLIPLPQYAKRSRSHTRHQYFELKRPYGEESKPEIKEANDMATLLVKPVLKLIAVGTDVLIENPLMSYFWMLDEVQILMGLPRMALVRIDQCTRGTRYHKPQLWLTTNPYLKGSRDGMLPSVATRSLTRGKGENTRKRTLSP